MHCDCPRKSHAPGAAPRLGGLAAQGSVSLSRMMLPIVAILAAAVPAPGGKAPAFSLDASTGKKVSLADFKGQTLVLAFFPKAFTGG